MNIPFRLLIAVAISVASCCVTAITHAERVSLTPAPLSVTEGSGSYTLPKGLTISTAGLTPDMAAEAPRFAEALNSATGLNATPTASPGADITISVDPSIATEGYTLSITPSGIAITASQPAGLFYAFQTILKMLPPNVMAGVLERDLAYTLPEAQIADSPRFPYRGFMLDVSRHFFDADQVKKMLDLMAAYKLNRFHWHLTDDQGWRLPVPKYPELTTVGATNQNILRTNFDAQRRWRDGRFVEYGPYAYTTDEIRDIVAYAKERHIEVIPEIDMPGHMVAAIHAYPYLSTDPESSLVPDSVAMDSEPVARNPYSHFTHNMWNIGGVSRDVLDVSKPEVMTFVQDVVDVLADLFPYEYIHIGGDECPTFAWAKSDSCQKLKKELGLDDDSGLQAWFTKQIAEYASTKHGRKIMGWNELITNHEANIPIIKPYDPVIFCWYPPKQAVATSEANGLKHVYTPANGGYYINRSYKGHDKVGAVGDGALDITYTLNPPDNQHCIGVQGTFWTEQVDRPQDLEYQALPRLIAVAEQGWSQPERKDYNDFMKRLREQESVMLDLAGYNYGRHQIVAAPADTTAQ